MGKHKEELTKTKDEFWKIVLNKRYNKSDHDHMGSLLFQKFPNLDEDNFPALLETIASAFEIKRPEDKSSMKADWLGQERYQDLYDQIAALLDEAYDRERFVPNIEFFSNQLELYSSLQPETQRKQQQSLFSFLQKMIETVNELHDADDFKSEFKEKILEHVNKNGDTHFLNNCIGKLGLKDEDYLEHVKALINKKYTDSNPKYPDSSFKSEHVCKLWEPLKDFVKNFVLTEINNWHVLGKKLGDTGIEINKQRGNFLYRAFDQSNYDYYITTATNILGKLQYMCNVVITHNMQLKIDQTRPTSTSSGMGNK